jgi:hypothetical protein
MRSQVPSSKFQVPRSPKETFPIRDRYTVSGHVVGDVCFTCRCRIVELSSGDESLVFAWCDCALPDDFAVMEIVG